MAAHGGAHRVASESRERAMARKPGARVAPKAAVYRPASAPKVIQLGGSELCVCVCVWLAWH